MFLYRIFDVLIKFAYQKSLQIYLYVLISASSPIPGAWNLMGLQPPKDFRNSEFGIQNSEFGIRNSEFGIRNSEFGIRNSEFGIRNSEFGIVNSYGNNKVSHLGHRRGDLNMLIPNKISRASYRIKSQKHVKMRLPISLVTTIVLTN